MCFKKNALSFMLLMSSINFVNAEDPQEEPKRSCQEEAVEQENQCFLNDSSDVTDVACSVCPEMCTKNVSQEPNFSDLLDKMCESLSEESRKEFELAFDELSQVFKKSVNDVEQMIEKHGSIIEKYKKYENIDKMNFMITLLSENPDEITKGHAKDFDQCISSSEQMKSFTEGLTEQERCEFKDLYDYMNQICKDTSEAAKSVLQTHKIVKVAIENLDANQKIDFVIGFDRPFPCSYVKYEVE